MKTEHKVDIHEGAVTIDGRRINLPATLLILKELTPRGANGFVFLAQDTTPERDVAVKIWIPKHHDARDKIKQAFAEARKIASVNHTNIVKVFYADQPSDDVFFLIMEHIDGPTLRKWLSQNQIDFVRRYNIWRGIADALSYAHKRDVYHGDIHAGNVLISGGVPKVIDFGTSIFARNIDDSRSRESKMVFNLVRELFPNYDLCTLLPSSIHSLRPELVLTSCDAWTELMWQEHQFEARREYWMDDPDMEVDQAIFHIGLRVGQAPVFNVSALAEWFRGIVREDVYVCNLLDVLIAQFHNVLHPVSPYSIQFDPDDALESKLARIEPIAKEALKKFINTGPWG